MTTVAFLAQFWGVVFVVTSISMLVRKGNVKAIVKLSQDEGMVVWTGFLGLMIGVAQVLVYNVWSTDWTVILTLIGWVTVLKGLIRLFLPETTQKWVKSYHGSRTRTTFTLVIILIIGAYLLNKGFGL